MKHVVKTRLINVAVFDTYVFDTGKPFSNMIKYAIKIKRDGMNLLEYYM